ncbi:hypothetical protein VRY85_06755 [Achromobacter sp. F4_2707]|uniref:hypothetical protein n=1 Tax=Achromobacter sp. F4_2707 TaxID=3114286 RepID=UPI0039C620B8
MNNQIQTQVQQAENQKKQRTRLTPAQQIQAAKQALARAQQRQRQHDTRSKIVLGGLIMNWVRNDPSAARSVLAHMRSAKLRDQDIQALQDIHDELAQIVKAAPSNTTSH